MTFNFTIPMKVGRANDGKRLNVCNTIEHDRTYQSMNIKMNWRGQNEEILTWPHREACWLPSCPLLTVTRTTKSVQNLYNRKASELPPMWPNLKQWSTAEIFTGKLDEEIWQAGHTTWRSRSTCELCQIGSATGKNVDPSSIHVQPGLAFATSITFLSFSTGPRADPMFTLEAWPPICMLWVVANESTALCATIQGNRVSDIFVRCRVLRDVVQKSRYLWTWSIAVETHWRQAVAQRGCCMESLAMSIFKVTKSVLPITASTSSWSCHMRYIWVN